jgi:ribosome-binding factor A
MSQGSENRGDVAHLRRLGRIEREIREVIAGHLLSGFRGELSGFVSVSRVVVSRDLRHAKVLITVLGTEADRTASLKELAAHAYEIQGLVNHALRMKFVPRLTFAYDEGMENSLRVEKILREIAIQNQNQNQDTTSSPIKDGLENTTENTPKDENK